MENVSTSLEIEENFKYTHIYMYLYIHIPIHFIYIHKYMIIYYIWNIFLYMVYTYVTIPPIYVYKKCEHTKFTCEFLYILRTTEIRWRLILMSNCSEYLLLGMTKYLNIILDELSKSSFFGTKKIISLLFATLVRYLHLIIEFYTFQDA